MPVEGRGEVEGLWGVNGNVAMGGPMTEAHREVEAGVGAMRLGPASASEHAR